MTPEIEKLRDSLDALGDQVDYLELEMVDDPKWDEPSDTSYLNDDDRADPDIMSNVEAMTATNGLISWFARDQEGYVGLWRGPSNTALEEAPIVRLDTEGEYVYKDWSVWDGSFPFGAIWVYAFNTNESTGDETFYANQSILTPSVNGDDYSLTFTAGAANVRVGAQLDFYNDGIMGRNWIHLQDGTGAQGNNDLTITTANEAKVGDTVLVTGKLILNKDFGFGYKYDAMIEDAKVTVE